MTSLPRLYNSPLVDTDLDLGCVGKPDIHTCRRPTLPATLEFRKQEFHPSTSLLEFLTTVTESFEISKESYDLAKKIEDFYTKKFMIHVMKGFRLSHFRQDLLWCFQNPLQFTDDSIRILYTLKEFYEQDQVVDRIAKGNYWVTKDATHTSPKHVLTYIDKTIGVKSRKPNSYYFTDSKRRIYRLNVDKHNSLINLLDWRLEQNPNIEVEGSIVPTIFYGNDLHIFHALSNTWSIQ